MTDTPPLPPEGMPPPPPPGGMPPPPPPGMQPPGGYAPPPPPGYGQPMGSPSAVWNGPPLADYGQRVVAYLIDAIVPVIVFIAALIVGGILGIASSGLFYLFVFLGWLGAIAYSVWNMGYLQGTTGQSLGKRQQGISLVTEAGAQPVGFGMAIARYAIVWGLGTLCGIYTLLDVLFPLWDPKRQRITDKMLKFGVVKSTAAPLDINSFNPFVK